MYEERLETIKAVCEKLKNQPRKPKTVKASVNLSPQTIKQRFAKSLRGALAVFRLVQELFVRMVIIIGCQLWLVSKIYGRDYRIKSMTLLFV